MRGLLSRALDLAARTLDPSVWPVTPPCRIVRWETDLEAWLAELRSAVLAKLSDGPAQLSSLVL